MKRKNKLICFLLPVLLCAVLIGIFWEPIIDWLPIDQSGWSELKNGQICYLDEDGDPVTGWQTIETNTHYFDPEGGAMQTGWLELGGKRHYLGSDGILRTGWQNVDNNRYYLDEGGAVVTGWQTIGGDRYYVNEQGNPATGWLEIDGCRHYLDETGILQTGWLELENGTYYLDQSGSPLTGWQTIDGQPHYLNEDGTLHTGWLEQKDGRCLLDESGILQTGWQEIDGCRYYLDENGIMQTGWLELDGQKYYLKEDGSAARGKLIVDDTTYYFTSTGATVSLVNYWNPLPSSFSPETVKPKGLCWISTECADPAVAMITDMRAAVGEQVLLNGYRPYLTQYNGFFDKVKALTDQGISYATACRKVRDAFAYPGTSEHQLGVALDVMQPNDLYYEKGLTDSIRWLHEHCWEYGFIIRYPEGKSHITGIIYEPWHFRYVGKELALELKDSGLCLEEYLDALTGDGTTCGDPAALANK